MLTSLRTRGGDGIRGGALLSLRAAPGWARFFPEVLGERIFPTRQEIYFLACLRAICDFRRRRCRHFCFRATRSYGMPDLEGLSAEFKIALDRHAECVDRSGYAVAH